MIVYRLANKKYSDDLSGYGAESAGGRWNLKGTRVLYTADSRALCMAEIAVHTPVGVMPIDYYLIDIEISDRVTILQIELDSLPEDWRKFPYSRSTQELGESFIRENRYLLFKVPSAVVQGDYNILINPLHKDFNKVKIVGKEKFFFDERLFR